MLRTIHRALSCNRRRSLLSPPRAIGWTTIPACVTNFSTRLQTAIPTYNVSRRTDKFASTLTIPTTKDVEVPESAAIAQESASHVERFRSVVGWDFNDRSVFRGKWIEELQSHRVSLLSEPLLLVHLTPWA